MNCSDFFFYIIQKKFNSISDAENHPGDLNLILRGIEKEATGIYYDWKYNMHRAYRNNVRIDGIARVSSKSLELSIPWISGNLLVTCLSLMDTRSVKF